MDPAAPVTEMPARVGTEGYALIVAIAPGMLGLLFTVMAIFMLIKLIKGM